MKDTKNTKPFMTNAEQKTNVLFQYIFLCHDMLVSHEDVRKVVHDKQFGDLRAIVSKHVLYDNAADVTKEFNKGQYAAKIAKRMGDSSSSNSTALETLQPDSRNTVVDLQIRNVLESDIDENDFTSATATTTSTIVSNSFEDYIDVNFNGELTEMLENIMEYMNSPDRKSGDPTHPPYIYDIQNGLCNKIFTVLEKDNEDETTSRKSLTTGETVFIAHDFLLFITGILIPIGQSVIVTLEVTNCTYILFALRV